MKVYFLNFNKLVRWTIITLCLVVSVYALNTYITALTAVPTIKSYDPIYQGGDEKKQVALICNVVWGEEHLPEMLQTLKKHKARMTFFVGGQWAEKFPELLKSVSEAGHEIGNHGYAHLHPTQISLSKNVEEVKKTESIILKLTGKKTNLFHPPYREINGQVAEVVGKEGYKTIMSSVDTIDWQRPPASVIVNRVTAKVHNGAIVLMHPTEPTKKALEDMILQLKEQGYQLVTVTELLSTKSNPEDKFNKDIGAKKE